MKKYISTVLALGMLFLSASCSKEHEEVEYTYYANIELQGEPFVVINIGHAYADPGVVAVMAGEDVTDQVKVTTDLDFINPQPGYYSINYSIVNADGFAATASREVIVTDPDDPVTGYYTVDAKSYRLTAAQVFYGAPYEIMIYGSGPRGNYGVNDLLGGWYDQRAGYGSAYAMSGKIAVAADGSISLVSSFLPGWGDGLDAFDGTYDAATSTLTWDADYAGSMTFHVIATKTGNIE